MKELRDGMIVYAPGKGIYRWHKDQESYETLYGEDLSIGDSTGVLFPLLIDDKVLVALGFKNDLTGYNFNGVQVERNLKEPLFTINGTPIDDLTDLYDYLHDKGIDIDLEKLFDGLSWEKNDSNFFQ